MEGYPIISSDSKVDVISGYVGTTDLFEQHGFDKVMETSAHSGHTPRWIVRREVSAS